MSSRTLWRLGFIYVSSFILRSQCGLHGPERRSSATSCVWRTLGDARWPFCARKLTAHHLRWEGGIIKMGWAGKWSGGQMVRSFQGLLTLRNKCLWGRQWLWTSVHRLVFLVSNVKDGISYRTVSPSLRWGILRGWLNKYCPHPSPLATEI